MKKFVFLALFSCAVPFAAVGCGGGASDVQEEVVDPNDKTDQDNMNDEDMSEQYNKSGYGKGK